MVHFITAVASAQGAGLFEAYNKPQQSAWILPLDLLLSRG